jgi:hypothetical protein
MGASTRPTSASVSCWRRWRCRPRCGSSREGQADYAEAISPVGPASDPHRGEYKAAWEVESGVREEPTRRAYGRITNSKDYAASVEFGNSHQHGQYVLTRAIDAMIRE